jgi:hypothetical protein
MNLKHIISGILVAVLLSGCMGGGEAPRETGGATPVKPGPKPTQPPAAPATQPPIGQAVVDNLQNLLSGAGMKCTYTDEGMSVTSYVKGEKKVRSEFTADGKEMVSILKDDTIYFGQKGEKMWFTMKFEEEEVEDSSSYQGGYEVDYGEIREEINKWDCKPARVDDRNFNPPAGVKLIDMSDPQSLMENAQALAQMYED